MNIKSINMNEEDLKRLLEKYYNGSSTDDDEKTLRAYFTENNPPPGYEAEKEIFRYYSQATEVPEPSAGFEARISRSLDSVIAGNRSLSVRKLLIPLISAAAGLLILTGSYFYFLRSAETKDTYANPEIAYAETMKILRDVSSRMNHAANSLKPVGRINQMREKSFGSINKSAVLVEKNLKSLGYLRNSSEIDSASKE
jgi:hypothetical protein